MQIIFRVETLYGIHDYDTLSAARKAANPEDHIQFVVNEFQILSRVISRKAIRSWAFYVIDKHGLTDMVDYKQLR